ncbi:hypothetical protein ACP4OV_015415 [Aristida adscensionis]
MKRQRSYGDGLDDDRRRFYDRGPPPPPPPRRTPREYEGDRFDRRKGFGGGGGGGGGSGSYDGRYREYPSPREYGGDRAMQRSESFSGFRRDFPKGFRSERDRSRRDGDGSSSWRRPGGAWRDSDGLDGYRAGARPSAASLHSPPPPPPRRSRSRSPSEPRRQMSRSRSPSESRRRLEAAKLEKSRKQSVGVSEMEEGEVAPDAEPKVRPTVVEHRKQVEQSQAKEQIPERGKARKVDSRVPPDLGTQGKGVISASDAGNAGTEEGKSRDVMVPAAEKGMDEGRENSVLKIADKVGSGHEVQAQDLAASDATKFAQSTSHNMPQELLPGEVNPQELLPGDVKPQEGTTNSVEVVEQNTSSSILKEAIQQETIDSVEVVEQNTSSSILKQAIQEEVTTHDETSNAIDEIGKSAPSCIRQGVLQEEVMVLDRTGSGTANSGKSASPMMQQDVMQEEALASNGITNAAGEVGKSVSSNVPQEVLREEGLQHHGTVDGIDRVEIGTKSGLLLETTLEKMTTQDETSNTVDAVELVSYSGRLNEVMNEEELIVDGTANTTGVAGHSISSDLEEEVTHTKAAAQEGTTSVMEVTGDINLSTGPQREVMHCLYQQASENKAFQNLTAIEEKMDEPTDNDTSQLVEEGVKMDHCKKAGASEETTFADEAEGANVFVQPTKEHSGASNENVADANLVTGVPRAEDKGHGIAFDVLSIKDKVNCADSVGKGVDLTGQLGIEPTKTSKSSSVKQENDTIKIGNLDLSLSLSGCLQNSESKCSVRKPGSLVNATHPQPLPPSSFCTNSDGFVASISLTNSQTLAHNPSCSLTQQSLDSYEHSVGSKPLFMGVGPTSSYSGWQAQVPTESTQKKGTASLLQRVVHNGHVPDNTLVGINEHNNGMSNSFRRHASIPGVMSPTHSHGSHNSGLERSIHRRQLTRERSINSLTRGERRNGEQLVINGAGVIERVISKVVSEPLHHTGRMLQEMTETSISYLREAISDIIVDPDRRGEIIALQDALKKRSDLNRDILQTCPRVLMEILVAIRTGLPYFIKKSSSVATTDLVDIFLNLKCCNLSCRSVLPVDDCDCRICQQKTGFCSSCMCIVCSKFDSASNTCSWVGCDVCLHWCHTDCGLRHSLIRKGQSAARAYITTEMQFHCAACGHPSEMFGFVKEVFRTCARQWRMETLVSELQYVERIFSASDDARGTRVRDFVKQMLIQLENKDCCPDVVKCVIAFFSDDDANLGIFPSVPLKGIPCGITEGIDGIPSSSRKPTWTPFALEGLPVLEKATVLSTAGSPSVHIKSGEAEFQATDNKPVTDELDSLVRLKQAEAKMYQERANDARNEADNLKHIVMVKKARIEEEFANQIEKLRTNELQQRRKQKIEELQVIERTHHEYLSIKLRMETSIRELLLKMEAVKNNLSL